MRNWLQQIVHNWRQLLLILVMQLLIIQPLMLAYPATVAAEDTSTSTYHDDASCASTVMAELTGTSTDTNPTGSENTVAETHIMQSFNITDIKDDVRFPPVVRSSITSRTYIDSVIQYYGGTGITYLKLPDKITYAAPNSEWVFVCDTAYQTIDPSLFSLFSPMSPTALDVLNTLADPSPKLVFKNPQDLYAVLGEHCAGGFDLKKDADGENPCISFNKEDDFFTNGVWDAPKVADKVVATLAYLITPAERGGAGREFLRIKKIIQYGKDDTTLGTSPVTTAPDPSTAADPSADADNADLASQGSGGTPVSVGTGSTTTSSVEPSSYTIDPTDPPYSPKKISSSLLIDQIDKGRVATRIVQKRFFGNNTTTYKYQAPFPIDVAWQSSDGQNQDPPPDFSSLSLIESSRFLTNAAIVQLLNQYGLGDLQIDTSSMDINNFGDVAMLVGESLMEQLLGSPNGSLKGWDLLSNLQSIGMAYLEQQMGLVPGALADRNPLDDIKEGADFSNVIGSIGRATVEYILGFPRGSLYPLSGSSSQLLESVGRRYLEQEVFKVAWGTLTPDATHPLNTVSDLLARLGEGRMEQVFKLPRQSLRADSYADFRSSSFKAGLLFTKDDPGALSTDDYAMADYISNQLNLAYTPYTYIPTDDKGNKGAAVTANTNMYGFTEGDFHNPAVEMALNNLTKFKQLVGSRVVEGSLGIFRREGGSQLPTEYNGTPPQTVSWGSNLNFQFRPQVHDFRGTSKNWCEETEFKTDYLTDPSNPDAVRAKIQAILNDGFKVQDSYGPSKNATCTDAKQTTSQSLDTDITSQAQQILFTDTPVQHTAFINQDKEPTIDQIKNHLNNDSAALMSSLLNTALLLYYNLPENQRQYSINTLSVGGNTQGTVSNADGSTSTVSTGTQLTLAQVLNELTNGSGSGTGFKFDADPDLARRISMIRDLMNKDKNSNIFNLDAIKDLPTNELNNALIDRINEITVQPSADNFAAQYNQPDFNGWLFLVQDLRARLKCKLTNGSYQLTTDATAYACTSRTDAGSTDGSRALDKAATDKVNGAMALVDQFYKAPWSMASTLVASLDAGAVQDPSGFAGQSMLSAAIGLSGQTYRMDSNRRFMKDSPQYNQDLMRLLIAPARNADGTVPGNADITDFFKHGDDGNSNLGQVGKQYAARKFSNDTLAQRTFSTQLKSSFKDITEDFDKVETVFDKAVTDSKQYGIDFSSLEDKGMADGDFQRIFMLDDASAVFERVGKEEILRAVWQRTGAAKKIKSTDQYTAIIKSLKDVSQEINFYLSRLNTIDQKITDLQQKLANIDGDAGFKQARDNLDKLRQKNAGKQSINIKQIQDVVRSYEPVLTALRQKKGVQDVDAAAQDIYQIMHLAEEIAAGKQLPQQQFGSIDPNSSLGNAIKGTTSEDSCFSKGDLLKTFTGKGNMVTNIKNLAFTVAGCSIDTTFGLPKGSVYNWYTLGSQQFPPLDVVYTYTDDPEGGDPIPFDVEKNKVGESNKHLFKEVTQDGKTVYQPLVPTWNKNTWSISNLQIAVGIANHDDQTKTQTNLSNLYEKKADEINAYNKSGQQILELTLLSKLTQLIPGVGGLMKKYGLTTRDFVKIMQGDFMPLAAKVGGTILDQALHLPQGTASSLINPVCHDNNGAVAKCNKAPGQAGTDPDNVRMETLADMGLRELGLTVPAFPTYFSFTSGGNLLDNWGNASISQALGLAPNSFSGKINNLNYAGNNATDCQTAPIRCFNSTPTLMSTFGMTVTPEIRNLQKIRNDLDQAVNSLAISSEDRDGFMLQVDSAIDPMYEQLSLGRLYDPAWQNKGWWGDPKDTTNATNLVMQDYALYANRFMGQLWKLESDAKNVNTGNVLFNSESLTLLRKVILHDQGELGSGSNNDSSALDTDLPVGIFKLNDDVQVQLVPRYQSYITYFQSRLDRLNKQYTLVRDDANADKDESFNGYLKGRFDANKINHSTGLEKTVDTILGNYLDKYITEQGPSWLKDLEAAFKLLTADKDICGTETGIGKFMATLITSTQSSCSFTGLKGTSTKDILYSTDSNYVRLRELLFDKYLSNVFSAQLEQSIGFHTGTFRAIIADPKRGDQILISEGVRISADKIFGQRQDLSSCSLKAIPDSDCLQGTITKDLKEAFMAGFYDAVNKKYTLNFELTRSVSAFNALINKSLDLQLARIGKEYIGVEITRADFNLAIHGDNRFFALIALQYTANQLNHQLFSSAAMKNPVAGSFLIKYADIRDAAGLPSDISIKNAEHDAQYDYLAQSACADSDGGGFLGLNGIFCYGVPEATLKTMYMERLKEQRIENLQNHIPGADGMYSYELLGIDTNQDGIISQEEITAYKAAPISGDKYIQDLANANLKAEGTNGAKNILHDRRVAAQNKVMYGMLDILAFTKDQNIPVGFSQRLLGKSSTGRIDALAEYAFNSLLSSDSALGKQLQNICGGEAKRAECYQFFKDLAIAIGSGKDMPTKLQDLYKKDSIFIDRLDSVFNTYFDKELGIKLPPGVFKGIYAWGMGGFKPGDFNKNSLCFQSTQKGCAGGIIAVPVGRILENWGISSIAAWGDKQFGFKAGTTMKFIQAVQLISTIQRLTSSYNYFGQELKFINDNDLWNTDYADYIMAGAAQNQKLLVAAKGQLAQLAGQIVTSLFSNQLSDADKGLGLPAGTSQIIVGAGVTYAIASLLGNPAKLLGGGFWVGVGIQLGLTLVFGVVNVEVTNLATGDGYYPFYKYGTGSGSKPGYVEHHTTDALVGEFDPTTAAYRPALKRVAQEKVTGLLVDLLNMPGSQWAAIHGFSGVDSKGKPDFYKTLWIEQLFTYGSPEFSPLVDQRLISLYQLPAPASVSGNKDSITFGYGDLTFNCKGVTYDPATDTTTCQRKDDIFDGFYPLKNLVDAIHIRW